MVNETEQLFEKPESQADAEVEEEEIEFDPSALEGLDTEDLY